MKKFILFLSLLAAVLANSVKAQSWSPVGGGIYGQVLYIGELSGELYAAGKFVSTASGPAAKVAKWNGTAWLPLGSGLDNDVYSLAMYNGELYAAGKFLNAGGTPANRVAKWDGTSWSAVGTGMDDLVRALAVDTVNNILYAAGDFTTAGGIPATSIAKWDGTSWSALAPISYGSIESLAMYNNQLVAGGNFSAVGTCTNIAIWTGTAWSNAGLGVGMSGNVHSLYVSSDNTLYVGGGFYDADMVPMSFIASFNGSGFTALAGGLDIAGGGTGSGRGVKAIVEYNSDIYVGGEFLTADGIPAKYIAKWDGAAWDSVSTGMNNFVYALGTHNSELYAGGTFTTAGGASTLYVAKWGLLTTGTENRRGIAALSVYPNPSDGIFRVKTEGMKGGTLQVTDVAGQTLLSECITGDRQLDLSGLPAGVYFLRVLSEEACRTERIVITK